MKTQRKNKKLLKVADSASCKHAQTPKHHGTPYTSRQILGFSSLHLHLRNDVWTGPLLYKALSLEKKTSCTIGSSGREMCSTRFVMCPRHFCGNASNPSCQMQLRNFITLFRYHSLDHKKQMPQLRKWTRQKKLLVPFATGLFFSETERWEDRAFSV